MDKGFGPAQHGGPDILAVAAGATPAGSVYKELVRLGESALWQLGSGAFLAFVASIILVLTKLGVWAVRFTTDSLFITFVIEKDAEAHTWLTHHFAKAATGGTRRQLFNPQNDFDSDDEECYDDYSDDDDEVASCDEDLLGGGPVGGVVLEARGGRSKRLLSRVIAGDRQALAVAGRRVWVQRQPAPSRGGDSGGDGRGGGRGGGRRRRQPWEDDFASGGGGGGDDLVPRGAFKVTVLRSRGVDTFAALLAAARSGFMDSRRGTLRTFEAAAVSDDGYTPYDHHGDDCDWDLCWDGAGGGAGGALGGAFQRPPPTLAWVSAPSFRAVSPGQVLLPAGHESAVADLVADVSTFLDSQGWYAQRGIPHRRGYLLHGPRGCGKTMVAAAVATALRLAVYIVNLADPAMSDEWLANVLGSVAPRSLILFERIDRAFDAERRRVADPRRGGRAGSSAALTFSGLLNALDGVCAFEGSVTVFTSELPREALDEALARPGRCDLAVHVPQATPAAAAALFSRFYGNHPRFREEPAPVQQFEEALRRRAAPFSMRDVVSFVSTRSPAQAVAEVELLGVDAAEAVARAGDDGSRRQQGCSGGHDD